MTRVSLLNPSSLFTLPDVDSLFVVADARSLPFDQVTSINVRLPPTLVSYYNLVKYVAPSFEVSWQRIRLRLWLWGERQMGHAMRLSSRCTEWAIIRAVVSSVAAMDNRDSS
jgi:hypothetical protein